MDNRGGLRLVQSDYRWVHQLNRSILHGFRINLLCFHKSVVVVVWIQVNKINHLD